MSNPYKVNDHLVLEFSRAVVDTFLRYRQRQGTCESGGILLGRVFPSSHILVDAISTPNRYDKAGFYYFERSRRVAQKIIESAWERSKGEQNYLGEWHSHPVRHPSPSNRDRQMIRNMFRDTRKEIDCLFLVIVGINESWVGFENGHTLKKLKPLRPT